MNMQSYLKALVTNGWFWLIKGQIALSFRNSGMEKRELFWVGDWIDHKELKISENRAFLYGDGFFESMRWQSNLTCQLWSFHWERLNRTLMTLKFPVPVYFTEPYFRCLIQSKLEPGSGADVRVKVVFWRQGEGKYNPENTKLAFMLIIEPFSLPWIQTIEKVGLAESVYIPKHPLSWIKTTSSMLYVAASIEKVNRHLDDLILKNENGFVIEGSYSCLFWGKDGCIFLPDSELGGLDSCMRKFLINFWMDKGIKFQLVREKWEQIPNVDWIGFGSGLGLRILLKKKTANFRMFLPDF